MVSRNLEPVVYTILALDVFQNICCAALGWDVMVGGWGDQAALTFPGWTYAALPAVSGIGTFQYGFLLYFTDVFIPSRRLGPNILCLEDTHFISVEDFTWGNCCRELRIFSLPTVREFT